MVIWVLLLVSCALLLGCAAERNGDAGGPPFGPDALLIDVRTREEYESGHIEGAKLIPYEEIGARIGELTEDRNREIALYCRSGRRSGVAQQTLAKMGFKNAVNVGGYQELRARLAER